jgi:Beta/Gamma crystallin
VKTLLTVFILLAPMLFAHHAFAACTPGPNQVSIFVDSNFGGACATLGVADYANSNEFGLPNDSISSIRVGSAAQAFVCRDANFEGTCQTVSSDLANLSKQSIGNDRISSLRVQTRGAATNCPAGADQASFFVDSNFSGRCVTLNFGHYPNASALNLPNDSVSSIRVGSATQAYVCRDDNYGGTCQKVTTSLAELSNQPIGNDQISSLMVQPLGSATGCIPAANQASFFMDANFSGQCVILNLGDYPSASAFGLSSDSISSIRLGAMIQAFVCRDNDFGGTCQTVTGNLAELSNQPIGNDQISSLKVQPLGSITSCTPGANQASFFVDSQFSGPCMTLGVGDYPTSNAVGLPNDSISSIKVGSNAQTFVCRDDHFGGQCQLITGNVPDLSNQPIGNDQISSLNVRQPGAARTCMPGPNQAAFYVDANFANACVVLNAGSYPTAAVFQLPNDSISSVRVGSQVTVLACRDAQFGGTCQTVTNNLASLGNQPIGNDTISSLKVLPRGTGTPCGH